MEHRLYYKYSDYLKAKYGEKVYKIPVNLPVSCPVRDGSKSFGGCIFCGGNAAGYEMHDASIEIETQILDNAAFISRNYGAKKFEIYLQNFTNTYMPLIMFEQVVSRALKSVDGIKILSVSTRPDCIAVEYLDILAYASRQYSVDITIELGLQSVNSATLKIINRGHSLAEYIEAVLLIKKYGFQICTHIITTFPWDTDEDVIEAAKILSILHTDSVKLHALYIEKGTALEKMYLNKEFEIVSLETYIKRTADFIEYLRPEISLQRLSGRVPAEASVFANWGRSHWVLTGMVVAELEKRNSYQGKQVYGCDSAVKQFINGVNDEFRRV